MTFYTCYFESSAEMIAPMWIDTEPGNINGKEQLQKVLRMDLV